MGLLCNGEHGETHRQHRLRKPYKDPASRGGLMRSNNGRRERGKSDRGSASARNGGERSGAFHGLANKAQIIRSAILESNQHRSRGTGRLCRGHAVENTRGLDVVKFLALRSERCELNRIWASTRIAR